MTSKERAALRSEAHHLEPIINVGKESLTPEVTAAIDEALEARKRLVFDEFLDFILALRALKTKKEEAVNNFVITDYSACEKLIGGLPFKLTNAQQKTFNDIKKDMSSVRLMSRMVEVRK